MSFAKREPYDPAATGLSLAGSVGVERPDGRAAAFARVVLRAAKVRRPDEQVPGEGSDCPES